METHQALVQQSLCSSQDWANYVNIYSHTPQGAARFCSVTYFLFSRHGWASSTTEYKRLWCIHLSSVATHADGVRAIASSTSVAEAHDGIIISDFSSGNGLCLNRAKTEIVKVSNSTQSRDLLPSIFHSSTPMSLHYPRLISWAFCGLAHYQQN